MTEYENRTQNVRLYDPHPGIGGAASPLPKPLRDVAQELDGQNTTLEKAIESFTEVADQKYGTVKLGENCILYLLEHPSKALSCWRLLRYEPVKE
ncbi:hypothetical protein HY496_02960 [Candidatus Woesearchaeota archaeon]|nr:hypothetical protein [Candidatus Woesearchaeota archaeon]